jgi:hypothetical protein
MQVLRHPLPEAFLSIRVRCDPFHIRCWQGLATRRHGLIYLMAMGFTGEPTAFVIGSGGAQKKNS